ncbi:eCIS core domain-containing protein [Natronobiforma cellulositropha]|uniref:eCIS core domain-containing protein n=1 Tax=Natronobiforma cellulositropha TaxID=1679076 RepID=UPI0021D61420|nr:DUF4157 domain-containing protein [Natronobiforma cellulositropha]
MSFDRDRRDRSNDESERNERTRRARVQAQTQRGARPYQYLNRVGQPSRDQAAILDQMILRRGLENVQELGERGELPEGCNTPMGEQVRVARVRSSWKAGVELDTESAMRSVQAQVESDLAGETTTPDVVRRVISQPGRPLEGPVREEMEARMGDSFSDVQLHTGPEAAKAASALEARAFTTGNHVVFNRGEYDPESPEGKYLLAHELAHVRQQTGGQISMLPQEGSSLVIDPDPELEREADEVARKALEGEGPVVAHRLGMDVHVQRIPEEKTFEALALFESENDSGEVSEFRQGQNANRIGFLHGVAGEVLEKQDVQNQVKKKESVQAAASESPVAAELAQRGPSIGDLKSEVDALAASVNTDLSDVGLTEDQRLELHGNISTDRWDSLSWSVVKGVLSATTLGTFVAASSLAGKAKGVDVDEIGTQAVGRVRRRAISGWDDVRQIWSNSSGSLAERAKQIEKEIRAGIWYDGTDMPDSIPGFDEGK